MLFTKVMKVVFFLVLVSLSSCKSKNATKEKLSRTWKMAGISGEGAAGFSDSIKQQMFGTRFMEFTKEGEMIATGGISKMQRGDYKIGDDGKTLFTTRNGRASDTMTINKLTDDTLILFIKAAKLELIWVPK